MKQIILSLSLLSSLSVAAQDVLTFKTGDVLLVKVQEITPQEIKYKRYDNMEGPLITILKNTAKSITYENGAIESLADVAQQAPANSPVPVDVVTADPADFAVGDMVETDYYGNLSRGKVIEIDIRRNKAVIDLNRNGKSEKVNRRFHELRAVRKEGAGSGAMNEVREVSPANNRDNPDLFFQGQADAKRYYNGYRGAGTGTFLTALLVGPIIGLIPAAACSSTSPDASRLGIPNNQLARNNNYMSGYTQESQRIKSRKVWGNYGAGSLIAIAIGVAIVSSYR